MAIVTEAKHDWVALGVEYLQRKSSTSAKDFAEEKGIKYSTFTKAMSRHRTKIELAYDAGSLRSRKGLSKREKTLLLINDFRESMRKKARNEGAKAGVKSLEWFRETAKTVRGHKVRGVSPGKLYLFEYDAKYKDELPYWDKYPLVVFLGTRSTREGQVVYGLNLHYIAPKARQEFLEELLKYASTDQLSNKTELKVNWSQLKHLKGAEQMIKAYIPKRMTGIKEVNPKDWANVIYLPLQKFVKGTSGRTSVKAIWSRA